MHTRSSIFSYLNVWLLTLQVLFIYPWQGWLKVTYITGSPVFKYDKIELLVCIYEISRELVFKYGISGCSRCSSGEVMRTCGFCFLIIKQKSQVLIISSQCLPTSCALKSLKKIKRRNTCLYVQNIIFTGMIWKMNMFLLLCTMRCKIHSWWLAVAAILQNPNCPLCNIDIFHQS